MNCDVQGDKKQQQMRYEVKLEEEWQQKRWLLFSLISFDNEPLLETADCPNLEQRCDFFSYIVHLCCCLVGDLMAS